MRFLPTWCNSGGTLQSNAVQLIWNMRQPCKVLPVFCMVYYLTLSLTPPRTAMSPCMVIKQLLTNPFHKMALIVSTRIKNSPSG